MLQLASRFLLSAVLLGAALPAQAVQRAYVSAINGNDANTATGCAASAPCRWFAGAMTVVDPKGEVVAMDSGAYGAVTITQSMSFTAAPGVYAGISVFAGNGVTIATPGVAVVLRGITINSMGAGTTGIHMSNGAKLSVERCVISNFPSGGRGVFVNTSADVRVSGTLFRDNHDALVLSGGAKATIAGSEFYGSTDLAVWVTDLYGGSAVTTTAHIDRSVASGGNGGFAAQNTTAGNSSRVMVSDSLLSGNSAFGVQAYAAAGAAYASVRGSQFAENYMGMEVSGVGATLVASDNGVVANSYGLVQGSSGVLESAQDNEVRSNGFNVWGTITTAFTKM
ncbi:hypothetical protein BURK2_01006 [Burkholderiales bacterium]|nr:MAG: right-handed parallel beta-helix repeat-containing protein [Burkholderiales bacterium]CAG0966073.1 hypothetical protein BURK2_01006 [Burkholderiales bacterium]